MQQTLETTLECPALLHKRLITADAPKAIHVHVSHVSDKLIYVCTENVFVTSERLAAERVKASLKSSSSVYKENSPSLLNNKIMRLGSYVFS